MKAILIVAGVVALGVVGWFLFRDPTKGKGNGEDQTGPKFTLSPEEYQVRQAFDIWS